MMGSLADKLLCYVSTALEHDTNYEIASEMVRNYSKLKNMNLGEIAELCYVSKSAISRFCRFIGFSSFVEFQNVLKQEFSVSCEYSKSFQAILTNNSQSAYLSYCEDLNRNLCGTISDENVKTIARIARRIFDGGRMAYFSHQFLWDIGHHFQKKMMLMDHYIELYNNYEAQLDCARELKKGDFAIVCSIGGSYPSRYDNIWNVLTESGCTILVITQNMGSHYWNNADYILRCGDSNKNDIGKYSALLIIDMIIMEYMKTLQTKGIRV